MPTFNIQAFRYAKNTICFRIFFFRHTPCKKNPSARGDFRMYRKGSLRFGRGGRAGDKGFRIFHLRAVATMGFTADGEHAVRMTVE